MGHRVSTEERGERTVVHLRDEATGAEAAVLPSFGFNLFDLRLPAAGEVRRIIHAREGWADAPDRPGGNGIPILFPFPNRINEGRYTFGGRSYDLPLNHPPHAIHGFAIQAPWEVVDQGADEKTGAYLVGRFQISRQAPEMLAHWPADAVLELRYALSGRRLKLEATVENPTADPLPFGFGIHPYFLLPIGGEGNPERTEVVLPASETWVLENLIPTGERREVEGRLDFRKGQPLSGLRLDDVLTGLEFDGGRCACRLIDRALGAETRLSFGRGFRELVVYTPPDPRGVIAVEPYTQTTDAINLQARGVDAGLRMLGAGERATLELTIETVG